MKSPFFLEIDLPVQKPLHCLELFPRFLSACSEVAKACGPTCCIGGAKDLEELAGGTVILGTRTYGVQQMGLGPSQDEVLEATVRIFKAQ